MARLMAVRQASAPAAEGGDDVQVVVASEEVAEDRAGGTLSLPTSAVSLVALPPRGAAAAPAASREPPGGIGEVLGDGETWEGEVYPASDDENEKGPAARGGDVTRQLQQPPAPPEPPAVKEFEGTRLHLSSHSTTGYKARACSS